MCDLAGSGISGIVHDDEMGAGIRQFPQRWLARRGLVGFVATTGTVVNFCAGNEGFWRRQGATLDVEADGLVRDGRLFFEREDPQMKTT